jgi:hypothetical protein
MNGGMIMAFCANCGTKMGDGVKFCPSCGTRAAGGGDAGGAAPAKPAKEKVGNIRKCPACGAEVESFQSRCANCGHEFNQAEVASSVKEFSNKILELELRPRPPVTLDKAHFIRGAIFMGIFIVGLGIGWAYVGYATSFDSDIYTLAAAVAALLFAALVFKPKAAFTETDNQKRTLIENFPIPNTREDIIEFLMLASSKIVPAHGLTGAAALQREWNKIWAVKCRQVYVKTDVVFAGDKQSASIVSSIRKKTEGFLKAAQKRTLIAVGAAAAVLIVCAVFGVIQYSGAFVSVPESVTIPPERVTLSGAFADSLKVTGSGVVITTDKAVSRVKMTVELEALEDINTALEREIQNFVRSKNWNMRDCESREGFTSLYVNGEYDSSHWSHLLYFSPNHDASEAYYAALKKLSPGTSRVLTVFDHSMDKVEMSPVAIRQRVAQFMALEETELRLERDVTVYNKVLKYPSGNNVSERFDLK